MNWTRTLILPARVTKDTKKLFNSYLWNGAGQSDSKANVAWEQICFLKFEGGLGL